MAQIDLNELTGGGQVRNLSGHERGLAAREKFRVNAFDHAAEPVRVLVPAAVYTLTPSFFQGLFSESVHAFGSRERFLAHYRFEASPLVMRQVDRAIESTLSRRREVAA